MKDIAKVCQIKVSLTKLTETTDGVYSPHLVLDYKDRTFEEIEIPDSLQLAYGTNMSKELESISLQFYGQDANYRINLLEVYGISEMVPVVKNAFNMTGWFNGMDMDHANVNLSKLAQRDIYLDYNNSRYELDIRGEVISGNAPQLKVTYLDGTSEILDLSNKVQTDNTKIVTKMQITGSGQYRFRRMIVNPIGTQVQIEPGIFNLNTWLTTHGLDASNVSCSSISYKHLLDSYTNTQYVIDCKGYLKTGTSSPYVRVTFEDGTYERKVFPCFFVTTTNKRVIGIQFEWANSTIALQRCKIFPMGDKVTPYPNMFDVDQWCIRNKFDRLNLDCSKVNFVNLLDVNTTKIARLRFRIDGNSNMGLKLRVVYKTGSWDTVSIKPGELQSLDISLTSEIEMIYFVGPGYTTFRLSNMEIYPLTAIEPSVQNDFNIATWAKDYSLDLNGQIKGNDLANKPFFVDCKYNQYYIKFALAYSGSTQNRDTKIRVVYTDGTTADVENTESFTTDISKEVYDMYFVSDVSINYDIMCIIIRGIGNIKPTVINSFDYPNWFIRLNQDPSNALVEGIQNRSLLKYYTYDQYKISVFSKVKSGTNVSVQVNYMDGTVDIMSANDLGRIDGVTSNKLILDMILIGNNTSRVNIPKFIIQGIGNSAPQPISEFNIMDYCQDNSYSNSSMVPDNQLNRHLLDKYEYSQYVLYADIIPNTPGNAVFNMGYTDGSVVEYNCSTHVLTDGNKVVSRITVGGSISVRINELGVYGVGEKKPADTRLNLFNKTEWFIANNVPEQFVLSDVNNKSLLPIKYYQYSIDGRYLGEDLKIRVEYTDRTSVDLSFDDREIITDVDKDVMKLSIVTTSVTNKTRLKDLKIYGIGEELPENEFDREWYTTTFEIDLNNVTANKLSNTELIFDTRHDQYRLSMKKEGSISISLNVIYRDNTIENISFVNNVLDFTSNPNKILTHIFFVYSKDTTEFRVTRIMLAGIGEKHESRNLFNEEWFFDGLDKNNLTWNDFYNKELLESYDNTQYLIKLNVSNVYQKYLSNNYVLENGNISSTTDYLQVQENIITSNTGEMFSLYFARSSTDIAKYNYIYVEAIGDPINRELSENLWDYNKFINTWGIPSLDGKKYSRYFLLDNFDYNQYYIKSQKKCVDTTDDNSINCYEISSGDNLSTTYVYFGRYRMTKRCEIYNMTTFCPNNKDLKNIEIYGVGPKRTIYRENLLDFDQWLIDKNIDDKMNIPRDKIVGSKLLSKYEYNSYIVKIHGMCTDGSGIYWSKSSANGGSNSTSSTCEAITSPKGEITLIEFSYSTKTSCSIRNIEILPFKGKIIFNNHFDINAFFDSRGLDKNDVLTSDIHDVDLFEDYRYTQYKIEFRGKVLSGITPALCIMYTDGSKITLADYRLLTNIDKEVSRIYFDKQNSNTSHFKFDDIYIEGLGEAKLTNELEVDDYFEFYETTQSAASTEKICGDGSDFRGFIPDYERYQMEIEYIPEATSVVRWFVKYTDNTSEYLPTDSRQKTAEGKVVEYIRLSSSVDTNLNITSIKIGGLSGFLGNNGNLFDLNKYKTLVGDIKAVPLEKIINDLINLDQRPSVIYDKYKVVYKVKARAQLEHTYTDKSSKKYGPYLCGGSIPKFAEFTTDANCLSVHTLPYSDYTTGWFKYISIVPIGSPTTLPSPIYSYQDWLTDHKLSNPTLTQISGAEIIESNNMEHENYLVWSSNKLSDKIGETQSINSNNIGKTIQHGIFDSTTGRTTRLYFQNISNSSLLSLKDMCVYPYGESVGKNIFDNNAFYSANVFSGDYTSVDLTNYLKKYYGYKISSYKNISNCNYVISYANSVDTKHAVTTTVLDVGTVDNPVTGIKLENVTSGGFITPNRYFFIEGKGNELKTDSLFDFPKWFYDNTRTYHKYNIDMSSAVGKSLLDIYDYEAYRIKWTSNENTGFKIYYDDNTTSNTSSGRFGNIVIDSKVKDVTRIELVGSSNRAIYSLVIEPAGPKKPDQELFNSSRFYINKNPSAMTTAQLENFSLLEDKQYIYSKYKVNIDYSSANNLSLIVVTNNSNETVISNLNGEVITPVDTKFMFLKGEDGGVYNIQKISVKGVGKAQEYSNEWRPVNWFGEQNVDRHYFGIDVSGKSILDSYDYEAYEIDLSVKLLSGYNVMVNYDYTDGSFESIRARDFTATNRSKTIRKISFFANDNRKALLYRGTIKGLGEKSPSSEFKTNSWFYNNGIDQSDALASHLSGKEMLDYYQYSRYILSLDAKKISGSGTETGEPFSWIVTYKDDTMSVYDATVAGVTTTSGKKVKSIQLEYKFTTPASYEIYQIKIVGIDTGDKNECRFPTIITEQGKSITGQSIYDVSMKCLLDKYEYDSYSMELSASNITGTSSVINFRVYYTDGTSEKINALNGPVDTNLNKKVSGIRLDGTGVTADINDIYIYGTGPKHAYAKNAFDIDQFAIDTGNNFNKPITINAGTVLENTSLLNEYKHDSYIIKPLYKGSNLPQINIAYNDNTMSPANTKISIETDNKKDVKSISWKALNGVSFTLNDLLIVPIGDPSPDSIFDFGNWIKVRSYFSTTLRKIFINGKEPIYDYNYPQYKIIINSNIDDMQIKVQYKDLSTETLYFPTKNVDCVVVTDPSKEVDSLKLYTDYASYLSIYKLKIIPMGEQKPETVNVFDLDEFATIMNVNLMDVEASQLVGLRIDDWFAEVSARYELKFNLENFDNNSPASEVYLRIKYNDRSYFDLSTGDVYKTTTNKTIDNISFYSKIDPPINKVRLFNLRATPID